LRPAPWGRGLPKAGTPRLCFAVGRRADPRWATPGHEGPRPAEEFPGPRCPGRPPEPSNQPPRTGARTRKVCSRGRPAWPSSFAVFAPAAWPACPPGPGRANGRFDEENERPRLCPTKTPPALAAHPEPFPMTARSDRGRKPRGPGSGPGRPLFRELRPLPRKPIAGAPPASGKPHHGALGPARQGREGVKGPGRGLPRSRVFFARPRCRLRARPLSGAKTTAGSAPTVPRGTPPASRNGKRGTAEAPHG